MATSIAIRNYSFNRSGTAGLTSKSTNYSTHSNNGTVTIMLIGFRFLKQGG